MDSEGFTPTKSVKFCCVCGEAKTDIRFIGSQKGKEKNLSKLLKKYGGLILVEGIICRNCQDKLLNLDKNATKFWNQCQSSKSKSKRCNREPLKDISSFNNTDSSDSGIFSPPQPLFHPPVFSTPITSGSGSTSSSNLSLSRSENPRLPKSSKKALHFTEISLSPVPVINSQTLLPDKHQPTESVKLTVLSPDNHKESKETHRKGVNTVDHDYAKKHKTEITKSINHDKKGSDGEKVRTPTETNLKDTLLKVFTKNTCCLTENDAIQIKKATQLGSVTLLAKTLIMECEELYTELENCIIRNSAEKMRTLFNRKHGFVSCLMSKKYDDLNKFSWSNIVSEGMEHFPLLIKLLLCMMVPPDSPNLESRLSDAIPRLGMVYGILAQTRNHELSKVQRVMSMNLADNIADQKIYDRLKPAGVCLSYQGTLNVMEEIGNHFSTELKKAVEEKKRMRIVGDNVNFSVGQADLRMNSQGKLNTLHHAFASAALIHNFNFSDLPETEPLKKWQDLKVKDLIPNHADYERMKQAFIFHVIQIALKFLPFFKFLKGIVKHPVSPHQNQLLAKTEVVLLDTLHRNEQKYDDVVHILDSYEKVIEETFKGTRTPTIHIGGDQLTRERFSGAKALRAGAVDPKEQLKHLHPITFEMFHLHMNFLMVVFKFLFSEESSDELGTMKCEINRIMRTNVDPDVKKAYEADKDFFVSFVDAHIVEMVCHYFGMETNLSSPTRNMPCRVDEMTDEMKLDWANKTFGEIVNSYVWKSEIPKIDENIIEEGKFLPIRLKLANGTEMKLSAKLKQKGEVKKKDDYVKNYAHMVVDLGLLFKELLYISKQPDREMILSLLKRCMIIFKSKSNHSKYAFEVHRFLVQQYSLLSQKEATETLYSMYVNTHGRRDTHIPADLQMEYLVKVIKKHIKHMFSNKTEGNISMRTKSLSGIDAISQNYDRDTSVVKRCNQHKTKDAAIDEYTIMDDLRKLQPFEFMEGRKHKSFPDIKPKVDKYLDINHLHGWIENTIVKHVYTP